MPFVTAIVHCNTDIDMEVLRTRLEDASRNAWSSLGDDFNREEVGGLNCRNADHESLQFRSPVTVLFFFTDRGPEFKQRLTHALRRFIPTVPVEFGMRSDEDLWIDIIPIPVPSGGWFADPVWTRAECTKLHVVPSLNEPEIPF